MRSGTLVREKLLPVVLFTCILCIVSESPLALAAEVPQGAPSSDPLARALAEMKAERWSELLSVVKSNEFEDAAPKWVHASYALGLAYAQNGELSKAIEPLFRARNIYGDVSAAGLECEGLYRQDHFGPAQARFDPPSEPREPTACIEVRDYADSILARSLVELVLTERKWSGRLEVALAFLKELLSDDPKSLQASTMVHDVLAFREAVTNAEADRLARIERFIRGAQPITLRYPDSPLPYYLYLASAQDLAWQGLYGEALREALERGKELRGESAK
ncbi:MAG: hypothetical protein ACRD1Z_12505, partial [Vicinamibacteria bacterium]